MRALDAAQATFQAGAFDPALVLLATAEAGPLDDLPRARIDLLRAQIAFASSRGKEAPPLLLAAARRLERLDAGLARETYLDAFSAAMFAGRLASGPGLLEVAQAARQAPPPPPQPRKGDMLLMPPSEKRWRTTPWSPLLSTAYSGTALMRPGKLRLIRAARTTARLAELREGNSLAWTGA